MAGLAGYMRRSIPPRAIPAQSAPQQHDEWAHADYPQDMVKDIYHYTPGEADDPYGNLYPQLFNLMGNLKRVFHAPQAEGATPDYMGLQQFVQQSGKSGKSWDETRQIAKQRFGHIADEQTLWALWHQAYQHPQGYLQPPND